MGSCLKNIDVMSIDVRKRSFLPLRAALIENCTSSLLQKTLTEEADDAKHPNALSTKRGCFV